MLSTRVNTGEEYRDVQCYEEFDWTKNEKRIVREDTKEVIAKYDITDYERQEQLKLDQAKDEKAGKKDADKERG